MAGGVGIEGNNIALPAGASCPWRPHPLSPSPQVEKGNPDEPTWRSPTMSISGPSLSTQWRGTEGEASEGQDAPSGKKLCRVVLWIRRGISYGDAEDQQLPGLSL